MISSVPPPWHSSIKCLRAAAQLSAADSVKPRNFFPKTAAKLMPIRARDKFTYDRARRQ